MKETILSGALGLFLILAGFISPGHYWLTSFEALEMSGCILMVFFIVSIVKYKLHGEWL